MVGVKINYLENISRNFFIFLFYLKLAALSVEWEGVEQHGTDEGDMGGLAVVHPLVGICRFRLQYRPPTQQPYDEIEPATNIYDIKVSFLSTARPV